MDLPETGPQDITVVGVLPPTPVALVESSFVQRLEEASASATALMIADANSQQIAAALLNDLTKAASGLENARKTVKEPFLNYCRKIDDAAKTVDFRITEIKRTVSAKMRLYQDRLDAEAREAERKRAAELARLEEQRRREEADRLKAEADEAARVAALKKPAIEQLDLPDAPPPPPTAIEQKIAAVQAAPAVVAPKPVGVRWTVTLKFEVRDVLQLPVEYQIPTANMVKIRGLTAGWREGQPKPVLAGVLFYEEKQFQGTGR